MAEYVDGVDVSSNQGRMNWKKAKEKGVKFAYIRCTQGDFEQDSEFERNWDATGELGIFHAPYYVGFPRVVINKQVDYFHDFFKDRVPQMPIAVDLEVSDGRAPDFVSSFSRNILLAAELEFQHMPIVYTAQWWWDPNILTASYWKNYPLWVANYTTGAKPLMPRDWKKFTIWQWSADGNGLGSAYGASGSKAIDLDRFNGNWEEFQKFLLVAPQPEPQPIPITLESLDQRIKAIEIKLGIG